MWVFLGMETIANIKYRSHVDSDSCLLAVCRWLIPHEVAPQQSFTMLQPANAKVIIKNGTTKNNHIYFILQFDPLKHSINNSSCNLTYTPKYPRRWIAQEVVDFKDLEILEDGELVWRKADLRAFVVSGNETKVWKSGLTRFSRNPDSFVVNSSQGGGFKDTWVMTE